MGLTQRICVDSYDDFSVLKRPTAILQFQHTLKSLSSSFSLHFLIPSTLPVLIVVVCSRSDRIIEEEVRMPCAEGTKVEAPRG